MIKCNLREYVDKVGPKEKEGDFDHFSCKWDKTSGAWIYTQNIFQYLRWINANHKLEETPIVYGWTPPEHANDEDEKPLAFTKSSLCKRHDKYCGTTLYAGDVFSTEYPMLITEAKEKILKEAGHRLKHVPDNQLPEEITFHITILKPGGAGLDTWINDRVALTFSDSGINAVKASMVWD